MKREEMISKLQTLTFAYVDDLPDAGFTERPLWVNNKGYGYLSCDDPSDQCWEGEGLEPERWEIIKRKLSTGNLLLEDLDGTSLLELLDIMYYPEFPKDEDPCEYLQGLLTLPDGPLHQIYCMNSVDGWLFFATEEEFNKAYERDWCDYAWEDLSDEILSECIDQLSEEGLIAMEYLVSCSDEDLAIDYQEFLDSLDEYYLDNSVDGADLETYLEEASNSLKEYLTENYSDVFYEILWDLYAVGKSNGSISYDEAYRKLVDETKENIHKKYGDVFINLFVLKANKAIKASCSVSVEDILIEFLDRETECSEFDAKVGKYVESSIFKFLNSSKWHYGYRNQDGTYTEVSNASEHAAISDKSCPVLWFGPDNTAPLPKWSIIPGEEHGFQDYDQWELLDYLVDDCNDCFSIWYLAECGYDLPDMEAILSECPITIDNNDDADAINKKIFLLFTTHK